MTNPVQDEDEDPMDKMNEDEEADGPSDDVISKKALAKKGLHIEGEDEALDPEAIVDPLLPVDPLLDDEMLEDEEDDDGVELEDDEFKDPEEW